MHRLIALRTAHCTQLSSQFSHTHPVTLTVPGVNCHVSSSALPLLQTTPLSRWHPVDGVLLHRHCLATWPLRVHCVRAVSSPPPRRCPFTTAVSLHYHRRRVTVAVAAAAAAERRHPRALSTTIAASVAAMGSSAASAAAKPPSPIHSPLSLHRHVPPFVLHCSATLRLPRGPLVTAAISSLPLLLSLSPHHPVPVLAGRHCTVTSMLPSPLSSDRFLCGRTRSRHRWLRPTRSGAYVCISSLSVICVHMLWLLGYDLA